jgi:PKD repeat protein
MRREDSRKALSILLIAFITLAMIPMLTTQVSGATDAPIYECSGAEPSQELGSLDEGLELTADTPTGSSYMLYDHHGGWWCDAEKRPGDDNAGNPPPVLWEEEDDLLCWAAGATNILEWTGWGLVDGMMNTDEIFEYFMYYWNDTSGNLEQPFPWWFDGTNPGPPRKDEPGGGAFWTPPYVWTDYFHREDNNWLIMPSIDSWFHLGCGVGLGIYPPYPPGGHVITCWGFNYNPAVDKIAHPEDYYLGIWVTDSDNSKGSSPPAPNLLLYFEVEWNGTYWLMPNYGSGWVISYVVGVEPFPDSNRPVANAGILYTGYEGSPITFDGSSSSDADGDSLQYCWDFDNDGVWDTSWSTSPTTSHTWYDDYTGIVGLQVYDGHLLDADFATVVVSNVAPSVTAGSDQTVDEGYIVSFSSSFTDPGTLDTHTIEWDFGDGTPVVTGTLTPTHAYGDNGVYTVTLTVTDDDGGVGTDTLTITVNNVVPTATVSMNQPNSQFILPIVHTLAFDGSFTDPGWLDTHTATWNFGDGTIVPGTVTEENIEPDATGTTTADHVYSEPGTYTVTLTITDDDGGVGTHTIQVIVVDAQEAVQITNDYIQALSDNAFKGNPNQRKKAFNNMFSAIDAMLDNEAYKGAIQHLRNNIQEKTDGSVGGNPNNDWITDPTAQQEICMKINDITAYLETLL